MIRIEVNKEEFQKHIWNHNIIIQENVKRKFNATILQDGVQKQIEIKGSFTVTGDTPDFYEATGRYWQMKGDMNGWNPNWDFDSFMYGDYSLEDYVDDEVIEEIIDENIIEVEHHYYLTNLPPACQISMNNRPNMTIEHEYDAVGKLITQDILDILSWRNYFAPDPNGLGTVNQFKLLGEILSRGVDD